MADSKITALTAISTVDPTADPLVIVDVSDTSMAASGTTKKSTINQLLGSGGTATLASATITGALGAAGLNVTGSTIPANGVYLGSANNLSFSAASTLGMTLNSTGLTIGGSAIGKLTAYSTTNGDILAAFRCTGTGTQRALYISADNSTGVVNLDITGSAAGILQFKAGGTNTMQIDTSGNVGIGVTPSAWVSSSKAIDIAAWAGVGYIASSAATVITNNTYKDAASNWVFKNGTNAAGYFEIAQNLYRWWQAPAAGGAGTTAAMVQAMTLDASGQLGIGVAPSYLLHTAVASGANRNIARFQVTGASNGLTITWNHATTKMIVNFSNLPTSSAGLASGDLWIDTAAGNTLKVA